MKMQFNLLLAIMVSSASIVSAQIPVTITKLGDLPVNLTETSGLFIEHSNLFWSMNDSGKTDNITSFDSTGVLIEEIDVKGAINIDWEEITADQDHFYIGDFGNNVNDRQNLIVYRMNLPIAKNANVDEISFVYNDQVAFPPAGNMLYYDCEAMIAMNDTLFLFTKDRTSPYQSETRMYTLPAKKGNQIASYRSTFLTNFPVFLQGSVTGAALSPDQKTLVLLGYARMWVFKNFKGSNFFDGDLTTFQFSQYSQREAVAFHDNCELYFTDEYNATLKNGRGLYKLDLCDYLTSVKVIDHQESSLAYPNPAFGDITIRYNMPGTNLSCELFDGRGNLVHQQNLNSSEGELKITQDKFIASGNYYYLISTPNHQFSTGGKINFVK